MDEAPDTGRVELKALANTANDNERIAVTKQDIAVIARQVDKLITASEQAQGAHRLWRFLGGGAFALAMALGTSALGIAWQAAKDHDRLERLAQDLTVTTAAVTELQRGAAAQATTLAASAARIDSQLDRIDDLLSRIDRRLDSFDQRLTNMERRH